MANLHFTAPMIQLQNPRQTEILIVTLAEMTPVLDAAHLQADLVHTGITCLLELAGNQERMH